MSAPAAAASAARPPLKRSYHAHSDDVRASVLRLRAEGASWQRIEDVTAVAESTARRWVAQHAAEGQVSKKPRGGSHHAVYPPALRAQATAAQDQDAALRLQDLKQPLQLPVDSPSPSLSTIWRWLHEAGFTTKNMQQYATQRSSDATKQKRRAWVQEVGAALTADTAGFIDESPFSMTLMRGRGRSRKGVPALGVVPAIRGKNHSVIAAISPSAGLLHFTIHVTQPEEEFVSKRSSKKKKTGPKGVTRDIFRSFVIDLLALPFFSAGVTRTLLSDNARIHKGDITDVIFSAGHTPHFLPPWSPELNPIEYAFSKWKLAYRVHYPPTEEAVDPAIRASAASITPADCMHYFEHTRKLYAACEALEDL